MDLEKQKTKLKKVKKMRRKLKSVPRYVVYVAHLPHGFYENELKEYFSQFGKITRLRVARSPKTGGSKGFAYIEFEMEEAANAVVESMNNYLFFEKLLKCELVPAEKLHKHTFFGWKKSDPLRSDSNRQKQNKFRDESSVQKSVTKRAARVKKLNESLNKLGINYSFSAESKSKK